MNPTHTDIASEMTRNLDAPDKQCEAAQAYGFARAEAGAPAADVVREVMAALPESSGRLRKDAIEAVARAVAGWEQQRRDRREAWLSFLVHDLKNPLNTVLNALWLLRGKLEARD